LGLFHIAHFISLNRIIPWPIAQYINHLLRHLNYR